MKKNEWSQGLECGEMFLGKGPGQSSGLGTSWKQSLLVLNYNPHMTLTEEATGETAT